MKKMQEKGLPLVAEKFTFGKFTVSQKAEPKVPSSDPERDRRMNLAAERILLRDAIKRAMKKNITLEEVKALIHEVYEG